nr:UBN2_2 domain-containing protein [Tanacetum cinerariifolium]
AIPDSENAKKYLSYVEEQFKGTSKAHASTLILKMLTTKYNGVSGVREHIMMMSDMANKLKGMDMEISEAPESIFDYYKDHGIINQYNMPGTPQQNGVAERRNRTLMDMINAPLDTSNDHLIAQDHPNNGEETEPNPEINVEPQETQQPLRTSQRNKKPTNFDDYYTYFNEVDFDLGKCNDPESFEDAITYD